jgi:hypothetical protein
MPLEGRFYTSQDLQEILGVSKQRVANIAAYYEWVQPVLNVGIYFAEEVESYLVGRNIDPATLPIVDFEYPDGATPAQRSEAFSRDYQEMMVNLDNEDDD